jgi:glycosyltransferase involved in cell wall biosynthesis
VLHILPTRDPAYGGPVVVVNEYVRQLVAHGVQADIFPETQMKVWGRFLYFPGFEPLGRLLEALHGYDLIHIHGLWYAASAISALGARRRKIPYLITPHGMLDGWAMARNKLRKRLYLNLIERQNLRGAAALHFLNEAEYISSKDNVGRASSTFILPNGIDAAAYANLPPRESLASAYPQTQGKLLLLFLGRINYKKGLDVLIPAFRHAVNKNNTLHLIIAGPDDGYLKDVTRLIVDEKLTSDVTLTGMVLGEEKLQILAAADLFVLPSRQEGDSIALKEALAAGVPILMSAACNFPEAEENHCGITVANEPDAIATEILGLADDHQRRTEMAYRARQFALSKYSWETIVVKLISEYRSILADGAPCHI